MKVEETRAGYALETTGKRDWPVMTIEEIADVNPRVDKAVIPDDLPVSFVPMPAVGAADGSIRVEETRPAGEVKKGFTAFLEGDVLFAKITPCMENGKMAVVPKLVNGYGFGSTEFHVLRPKSGMDAMYIYYYVSSQIFRGEAERYMTGAVGQKRVSTTYLKQSTIPVAPLDQQKRIVAEIEKQFSRLDEAVANLKRVKASLKRYKAAVLKAAVEGRLVETEAERARREGRSYETGKQLLQRILETRRSQWQGKGKYKDPTAPDTTNLPELPEGWVWASLDQACVKITDGTHHSPKNYPHGEYKYITSKNVREFRLALEDITYVDKATHDEIYARCDVRKDDVLYVKDGVNTGLTAKNTLDEPFSLLSSVGVFRALPLVSPDYLVAYLNSTIVRDRMLANIAGVAITRLTLNKLKVTAIAIPPITEQDRIVAEVDRHLSLLSATEAQVDANLKRAERLRQSILSRAFSGDLLSKDVLRERVV
ncbi:MAG: restriction endonuclease subunit S [Halothiobacillus sp.]